MPLAGDVVRPGDNVPTTWTAYTPTWTATTTNPTLGNSTLVGEYVQHGKLVFFRIKVTAGATGFAAGTGAYLFSLPVTAATSNEHSGTGIAQDGTTRYPVTWYATNTTQIAALDGNYPTAGLVGAASPFTPNAGDSYWFSGTYEAA